MKASEESVDRPNDLQAHSDPRPLARSLSRDAYVAPHFYVREQNAIFWDQWFCIGRAQGWAQPGHYRVLDVAGESVIVVRDGERFVAHVNLCRHRGSRLLCGEGELRGAIRCPYHGWAYAADGALIASPFVPPEEVPQGARRLHHVGLQTWGGFLFVHLSPQRADPERATLMEQLGQIAKRVARYPLEALRVARSIEYDVDANWKVLLENYNECYHCAGVHPELCRIVPSFKERGGAALDWERGIAHREGAWTFSRTGTSERSPFPGLDEDERVRHKGELLYPNLMLSLAADHVAAFTLWPRGPAKTSVVCEFLFHPAEMAKPGFDPSDAVGFWNLVNEQDWKVCEGVQSGMNSRFFQYGFYAPMEDASLDIRRYIASRLGEDAILP